jgi:uridine kinase
MPTDVTSIHSAKRRDTVQVTLPDGRVLEGNRGTPLVDFFQTAFPQREGPPIAAVVGGALRELAWPVLREVEAEPIYLSDSDGMRIYCRSLSFLLIVATHEVFPGAQVFVDYSVPYGGYFCRIEGRAPLASEELARVERRMRELVEEDHPIERQRLSVSEARRLFASRGEEEKSRVLRDVTDRDVKNDHLHLYKLKGFLDYFYGYMVPSTGYLKIFALEPFPKGFVLRFPRREDPTVLASPQQFDALQEVFTEYGEWLNVLGLRSVDSLNEAIHSGRIEEIILVAEALHEKRIAEIADVLAERHDETHRLVFIAGPSASGKTTFSKRLAIQLLAAGIRPYPIAMDDYFIPRSQAQADGVDSDSFEALDLTLFEAQIADLLKGKKVTLPRYNFHEGVRETGPTIRLEPDQILILEGIHGLNPRLLSGFSEGEVFRIFVSALTQLNLDRHNRVPTTDTRLIRRIVRDAVYRGYNAEMTLSLWESVRRGEKQNIFPYQEQADTLFNSALAYELAALKPLVEPLLRQVRRVSARIEAERLLAFLGWFEPYVGEHIPGNSILREFIGGSLLRDFSLQIGSSSRS